MRKNAGKLDDTLAAMFSNVNYRDSYLFYAHMVGKCSIRIRRDLPAAAGVRFNLDHYELFINPDSLWVPFSMLDFSKVDDMSKLDESNIRQGEHEKEYRMMKGFDDFTLVERLAILKHEMLHILYGHVTYRKGESFNHKAWNYGTDCALNQDIDPDHLPDVAVTPKILTEKYNKVFPLKQSSELYYNMLLDEPDMKNDGSKNGNSGNKQLVEGDSDHGGMDSHEIWEESKGDKELQKDITKKMLEGAQEETIKSRGTLPYEMDSWIRFFSRKAEVNWRKVLRGIVGNKRVGKRRTIMRNNRRFPKRDDLRGHIKDRTFNLLVIADVSGSMSHEAVIQTLQEVQHICDLTKTDVDLIQIDTQAYKPEKLSKKTKAFQRKGCGGTTLYPALEMAKEHRIDYQAVVVLTDGGLCKSDIEEFQGIRKKVIWLIESDGAVSDEMNEGLMKSYKLTGINKEAS